MAKFKKLRAYTFVVVYVFMNVLSIVLANNFTLNPLKPHPRDPSAEQLIQYQKFRRLQPRPCITTSYGVPVDSSTASSSVGPRGPLVLEDVNFIDAITYFDRERIPERVVHAKGAGAAGYFEITHDITAFSKAVVFSRIGKRTNIAVRLSLAVGKKGSPDTARGLRGFALKFYTEQGNWDLVTLNWPVFSIKDPMLFPSFVHSQERNPVTHLIDADMFWDFVSLRPETIYFLMFRFSDEGITESYRYISTYAINTFKLVNAAGEAFWCKFHLASNQGVRNMTTERARQLAATDPDYYIRDLYDAIYRGEFPSWTFFVQIMPYRKAATCKFDPFDPTKEWPDLEYPRIPVGKIVLNQNPSDYFSQVEQIAFSPGRLIPGIEASPDKILQGRLFSYHDTQLHRLGSNYLQLPINRPTRDAVTNYERDGPSVEVIQNNGPNYYPNSFDGPKACPMFKTSPYPVTGVVDRYESTIFEDNWEQPRNYWKRRLNEGQRTRLVENIANSLFLASEFIQERQLQNFARVSLDLAGRIRNELNMIKISKNYPKPTSL